MSKKKGLKLLQDRIFNLYQFRNLFGQLIIRDIKLKYRRSVLGYVWSILNPLLIMTVQAVVFSLMFTQTIEHFPAYLIAGNVLFNFMRESTEHSLTSISGNAALLKKTYVPKYIFSLSKVTSDLVNLFFSFGALILVLIFTRVPFSWSMLLFIIPVIELYVFCLGLGLFLAQASVFFRDVQYIWGFFTTAWMYLTPLFYDINILPEEVRRLVIWLNPMYYYIKMFRDLVVYGQMTDPVLILLGGAVALLVLFLGIWVFLRNKDKLILYI